MSQVFFAATEIFNTGGIQRFNRNLLDAWRENGTQVTVLTLNESRIETADLERYPDFTILSAAGNKLRFAGLLVRYVRDKRYRRIICGHLHLASLVVLAALVAGTSGKTVLILHGVEVWNRIRGLKRILLRYMNAAVAVSSYTRQSFLDQVPGYPPKQIQVFPNTVQSSMESLRMGNRSDDGMFRILSVTRLSQSERDKGLRDVLDALSGIKDFKFDYTIVGDGDDREELRRYATQLGLGQNVHLPGRVDDQQLWELYRNAHVFVLPSRKEGFGIVFLEAMRFGLPVIAAAEKGALDVIEDRKTGLLVNYGDSESIASTLLELHSDSDLRAFLVRQASDMINPGGKFSFEAFRLRTAEMLS